jgi:hypothetical protein
MPHSRHALKATVAALFMLASAQVFAWGSAAYSPDSGYIYVKVNEAAPELAAQAAVDICEADSGGSCLTVVNPVRASAIVIAKDQWEREFVHADAQPTVAMRTALAKCKIKGGKCKVDSVDWDQGATWSSVAFGGGAAHVAANHTTRSEAVETAVLGCEQINKSATPCEAPATFTSSRRVYVSIARLEGYDWHGIGWETTHEHAQATAARRCVDHAESVRVQEGALRHGAKCKVGAPALNEGPVHAPADLQAVISAIRQDD